MVRIVGGEWRGRKFPAGRHCRPSGDKVRESLFNCLGQRLDGKVCLDLFAGSGVLGLECLSRGADSAVLVERCRTTAAAICAAADALPTAAATVINTPTDKFLRANATKFDVVFLDPPFADYGDDDSWRRLLQKVQNHLAADGEVYCESDRHFAMPAGWAVRVRRRAGEVHWQIAGRKT